MSLEAEIKALREAIEANTAALAGAGAKTTRTAAASDDAGEKETTTRTRRTRSTTKDTEAASKYTAEQVKAAAVKMKDELGTPTVKKLIKKHGAAELAALKPAVYEAFVKDCEKCIEAGEFVEDDDDDGGDDDL